jgi:uncharacterized sulfatase
LELSANTIVIFVGDHGYHLGERGWWNKNTLFELSCRAPMIIVAPVMAKSAGKTCPRLVEFVDLYPTLLDLCAIEQTGALAGTSLRPLLDSPEAPWDRPAFTQVQRSKIAGRTVRTERWRYTEWDDGREGVELYDHDADPGEWHNLAPDAKYADDVAKMKALLHHG